NIKTFSAKVVAYDEENEEEDRIFNHVTTYFSVPKIIKELILEKTSFRAREALNFEVVLYNNMKATWNQTVTTSIPSLTLSETKQVSLEPGSSQVLTFNYTLSTDPASGLYQIVIKFVEENILEVIGSFFVPKSSLEYKILGQTWSSGGNLDLEIENTGGIDTDYELILILSDPLASNPIVLSQERLGSVNAGESIVQSFQIPDDLVKRTYYVYVTIIDGGNGDVKASIESIFIDGVGAILSSETEQKIYSKEDLITILTNISDITSGIDFATLNLKILSSEPLPPQECVILSDDLFITEDTTLCPGSYYVDDINRDGVLKVNNDNIAIRGNNTILVGNGAWNSGYGIYNNGFDNISIEDLEIQNYEKGIYFRNSEGNQIQNNTIIANIVATAYTGILHLRKCSNSFIVGNNVTTTSTLSGIFLEESSFNTITSNHVYSTGSSIVLDYQSNNNTITSNNVTGNSETYQGGEVGLSVSRSSNNLVSRNVFTFLFEGIRLSNADNNNITENDVSGSTTGWRVGYFGPSGYGIEMYSSDNNTVKNNNASSHGTGIRLYGSKYNEIMNNTLNFNIYRDNLNRYFGGGLDITDSDDNYFANNNVSANNEGIKLLNSGNNIFRNNQMTGNNFNFLLNIAWYPVQGYNNDIDMSNLVNGKPIYYIVNGSNLMFDQISNAGTIYCVNCDNVTIKNLSFTNNGAGVYFYNTQNSLIQNSTVNNSKYGFILRDSVRNTINQNSLQSNGVDPMAGVYLWNSSKSLITQNNIVGINRMYGVELFESDHNEVFNNTLSNLLAIYVRNSYNTTIIGNEITPGGSTGIYFRDSNKNNVTSNNVRGGGYGLSISNGDNNTVLNNNFTSNGRGMHISNSDNNLIKSNIADLNGIASNGYGIVFDIVSNSTMINNTANSNGASGIFLSLVNNCTISGNNASNQWIGMYLIAAHYNLVSDNFLNLNALSGIQLENSYYQPNGSNNNTFTNNTVTNNKYGIRLLHSSTNNTIQSNLVCANTEFDIVNSTKTNLGIGNTCNSTSSWNDQGTSNCTYVCLGVGSQIINNNPNVLLSSFVFAFNPSIFSDGQIPQEINTASLQSKTSLSPEIGLASIQKMVIIEQKNDDFGVWERNLIVDLTSPQQLSTSVGNLNITGKLYLQATLYSPSEQIIGYSVYPFYISESDLVLVMDTDKKVYKEGETINITGLVKNKGANITTTLILKTNETQIHSEILQLESNETYPYTLNLIAQSSFSLNGLVNGLNLSEYISVEKPAINTTLIGPNLVGSEEFEIMLTLENTGNVSADLNVELLGENISATLSKDSISTIKKKLTITSNTTLTANITGDINITLQKNIIFGEKTEIFFQPEDTYTEGLIQIPYVIFNVGEKDSIFNVTFKINDFTILKKVFVSANSNLTDTLFFTLEKGMHSLEYNSSFWSGIIKIDVESDSEFVITWVPEELVFALGERASVSVSINNTGGITGEASLQLESPGLIDVNNQTWINPGEERNITLSFLIPDDVEEKFYEMNLVINNITYKTKFKILGAKINVTAQLDKPYYELEENISLTLMVENLRDLNYSLYSRLNLGDNQNITNFSLSPWEVKTFNFIIPNSQDANKLFFGIYMSSGRSLYLNSLYIIPKPSDLAGIMVYSDKQVYEIGEEVQLYINTTKAGSLNFTALNYQYFNTSYPISQQSFSFNVPTLRSGAYQVSFTFGNYTSTYPIDVLGYSARILDSKLDKPKYGTVDTLRLSLTVDVNQPFDGFIKSSILNQNDALVGSTAINHSFLEEENSLEFSINADSNLTGLHSVLSEIFAYGSTIYLGSGVKFYEAIDTSPPTIFHIPVTEANVNSSIEIIALVSDNVNVTDINLYYKRTGETNYTILKMNPCGSCIDTYNTSIPASAVTTSTIAYYINASDGSNWATNGTVAEPNLITINFDPINVTSSLPTQITHKSMELSWTENNDPDFNNYTIYRSETQGLLGTPIHTITERTTTNYSPQSLSSETTYYFTIRVFDKGGLYADSNQVAGLTRETPFQWTYIGIPLVIVAIAVALFILRKKNFKKLEFLLSSAFIFFKKNFQKPFILLNHIN
ncbi:MAG: NosD domain-containing protein, partial [Candidatus Kariarchaeaceae archaeon]